MRLACLWLALYVSTLCACETKNIGGPVWSEMRISGVTFSNNTPTAGETVTATINFQGNTGPYTFTVTFADCVTPAVHTVTAPVGATTASLTFTLDAFTLWDDANGKDCAFTVTGTDAVGTMAGPATGTFHVDYMIVEPPALTTSFNFADCSVTATVQSLAGNDVTIEATTVPAAIVSNTGPQTVVGGNGSAVFFFSATDLLAGGSGAVTFTATDTNGAWVPATVTVTCPGIGPSLDDTLFAIPYEAQIHAGERVRVVVAMGDPANAFQYLNAVRVTIEAAADARYVGGSDLYGGTNDDASFNVGAVGGAQEQVDGFWSSMAPVDFLLAPDVFNQRSDAGNGLHGFDFNLTPLAGSDVTTGSGELFNFELQINNPGTWTLGFQAVDSNNIPRTYYQDANLAPDYFWGDITNNHAGVPHSIIVLP
jgi:hypothetical protein